jgi:hypothetical protein
MPLQYPRRYPTQPPYSTRGLFQSSYKLEKCCFCTHTNSIGILVLVKWVFSQDTIPDMSIKQLLKCLEKDMRLIALRNFTWDKGFPD